MRLDQWLKDATAALAPVAEQPRSEARRLVTLVTCWEAIDQISEPTAPLTNEQHQRLDDVLARRKAGEPLSRILGTREFWGLEFGIQGATLDPRADTETVIELTLELLSGRPPTTVLDLGTGSGALLLALLSEYPDATGLGVDQDAQTLETANMNSERLGLAPRARFHKGDWLNGIEDHFDLMVSNPPYIPTADVAQLERNVRDFDDSKALDGGADGLEFYRRTLVEAMGLLVPQGLLVFELGIHQLQPVIDIAEQFGWHVRGQKTDLSGIPRAVAFGHPSKP